MCGIHGFNFIDRELQERMVAKTRHRGPDSSGMFSTSRWSLGFNRLAIIDLSPNGNQPMRSSDGRHVIVFNGEVYNFKELRNELSRRGHSFSSGTDTEAILAAYREWGEACLDRLNGMFAFAIIDTTTGEAFVARDRLGIKPLYYSDYGGMFIFSSEAKAILEHAIPRDLDLDALNMYFRVLYVPAPYTIWKHIRKLEPGHFLRVTADGVMEKKGYWSYGSAPLLMDPEEMRQGIRDLLTDSVRMQLVSDRPVGVFLSGGIDSTIVASLMSRSSKHVRTFSAGFEETEESDKYNNDMRLARQTAAHLGADHHEYRFTARDIAEVLPEAVYHMDEPISNHVQPVNLLLARAVSTEATVVLGGDGGDELFGGYERYYYLSLIERMRKIPPWLRRHPFSRAVASMIGKRDILDRTNEDRDVSRYLGFFAQKESRIAGFLKPHYNRPGVAEDAFETLYFSDPEWTTPILDDRNFVRTAMRTDVRSWLPHESLARSDKMSMAASIEERVPFLDHRLVELADRIPVSYKLGSKGWRIASVGRHYEGKTILKEAMIEHVPPWVLGQQKWGWFSPAAKWIRGPLLPLMRDVISPSYNSGTKDMFDFSALEAMLEQHVSKEKYALVPLWSILTFQLWYRQFMSG